MIVGSQLTTARRSITSATLPQLEIGTIQRNRCRLAIVQTHVASMSSQFVRVVLGYRRLAVCRSSRLPYEDSRQPIHGFSKVLIPPE